MPDEVEITPQMVDAGVDAYSGFFLRLHYAAEGADRDMVAAVFQAMVAATPKRDGRDPTSERIMDEYVAEHGDLMRRLAEK